MFTGIVLHFLLKELGNIEGRRIKNILKKGYNISLNIGDTSLTACFDPRYTHLSISRMKGERFYSSLFRGKSVEKVFQNDLDRVLVFKMSDGIDIVFELFGRHSEFLLLRNKDVIYSMKGEKKGKYVLPDIPSGMNILKDDKDTLRETIVNGKMVGGLTKGFIRKLRDKGNEIIEEFIQREYRPTIYEDILSPFRIKDGMKFSSMNGAIDYYYNRIFDNIDREDKKFRILKNIDRKITRREEALKELSRRKNPEIFRLKGEAILKDLNSIQKGMEKLCVDYLGKKLDITLNPALSPGENAQVYFKRYKNSKKNENKLKVKNKTLKRELADLRVKKKDVESGNNLNGYLDEYISKDTEVQSEKASKFRTFSTLNGYTVLVGKNNRSNHELTFRYARPYDIFLHVKNAPGAHVILRIKDKNKRPPSEDIEEAAIIAARFSSMKKSNIVPVSYTEKKYVRSGKKLKKGKVLMEREKVVYIRLN